MHTIQINNGKIEFSVDSNDSLLKILEGHNIFLPSACGGRGVCGRCRLRIPNINIPFSAAEEKHLSDEEKKDYWRLACQVSVDQDLKVEVPENLLPVKKFKGKLIHKHSLTHDTDEIRINLTDPTTIEFEAGQYIQIYSGRYQQRESVMRAYSIASSPSSNHHIDLVIRRVPEGICTTWVFDHLHEGDIIEFTGPYGESSLRNSDLPIILIAGGSGMAPVRSILQEMKEKDVQRKTIYIFGAKTQDELFYIDELRQLEQEMSNFRFIPALSDEPKESNWKGERGLVTEVAKRHFPDTSKMEAYLCGSPGMIQACIDILTANGMSIEKICYDKFE